MPYSPNLYTPMSYIETPETPDEVSTLDMMAAAFRTQNTVGSAISSASITSAPDYDYDAIPEIIDTPYAVHARAFLRANNAEDVAKIKLQIDREISDRETLDRSGGAGVLWQIAAGIFDPINLIPVGGVATKAYKAGKLASIATGALRGAVAGVSGAALSEASLQSTQYTRTADETFATLAGGTVLGGVFGASAAGISRLVNDGKIKTAYKTADEMGTTIRDDITAAVQGRPSASEVGAAQAIKTTLEEEGIKGAAGVEKIAKTFSPLVQMLSSKSTAARRATQELVDIPFALEKNAQGIATGVEGGSAEVRRKLWDGYLYTAVRGMEDAFIEYRTGQARKFASMTKIGAKDTFTRNNTNMTWGQFKEAVAMAGRRGDMDENPFVQRAAKSWRALDDMIKNNAVEVGLMKADANIGDTAVSHVTRFHHREKIIAKKAEWLDIVAPWIERTSGGEFSGPEARSIAEEIANRIVGSPDGRLPYDEDMADFASKALAGEPGVTKSGLLKERTFNIPDALIEDFLENDIEVIARRAVHGMAGDIELARTFGKLPAASPEAVAEARTKFLESTESLNLLTWDVRRAIKELKSIKSADAEARRKMTELKGRLEVAKKALSERLSEQEANLTRLIGRPDVARATAEIETKIEKLAREKALAEIDLARLEGKSDVLKSETAVVFGRYINNVEKELDDRILADMAGRSSDVRSARSNGAARENSQSLTRLLKKGSSVEDVKSGLRASISDLEEKLGALRGKIGRGKSESIKGAAKENAAAITRLQSKATSARAQIDKIAQKISDVSADMERISAKHEMQQNVIQDLGERLKSARTGVSDFKSEFSRLSKSAPTADIEGVMVKKRVTEDYDRLIAEAGTRKERNALAMAVESGDEAEITKAQEALDARLKWAEKHPKAIEAERKALEKEKQEWIGNFAAMRDYIRGRYRQPDDPTAWTYRAAQIAKKVNVLRLLGGMTISAFSDTGKIVQAHGLMNVYGEAIRPMVKNMAAFKASREELRALSVGLDMFNNSRMNMIGDVFDDYGRLSKFERFVGGLTNANGLITLMAPWNSFLKQMTGVVSMNRILKACHGVADGTIAKKELAYLASGGIDADTARQIVEQYAKHGKTVDGVYLPQTAAWDGPLSVTNALKSAVLRDVDKIIVTPGAGDLPLFMRGTVGSLFMQFKSFGFASVQRTVIPALQQRDAAALNGTMLMVGAGMLTYAVKTKLAGRELSDDPMMWLGEGIDRSGVTGIFMDAYHIADKVTGHSGMSRYASRDVKEALFGPTFGSLADVAIRAGTDIGQGKFDKATLHTLRRIAPYQNLFYTSWLYNSAERGIAETFGVPLK